MCIPECNLTIYCSQKQGLLLIVTIVLVWIYQVTGILSFTDLNNILTNGPIFCFFVESQHPINYTQPENNLSTLKQKDYLLCIFLEFCILIRLFLLFLLLLSLFLLNSQFRFCLNLWFLLDFWYWRSIIFLLKKSINMLGTKIYYFMQTNWRVINLRRCKQKDLAIKLVMIFKMGT